MANSSVFLFYNKNLTLSEYSKTMVFTIPTTIIDIVKENINDEYKKIINKKKAIKDNIDLLNLIFNSEENKNSTENSNGELITWILHNSLLLEKLSGDKYIEIKITREIDERKIDKMLDKIRECNMCDNSASHKCSVCQDVYYCCREHQKQDWKKHKLVCQPCK